MAVPDNFKESNAMNKLKLIKHNSFAGYTLTMTAFCLPMTLFCLLVAWGIEVLARELFRLY
jgi:hypothetical protein